MEMVIAIDLTALDDNFTGIERYALNMALAMIRLASLNPADLCQNGMQSSRTQSGRNNENGDCLNQTIPDAENPGCSYDVNRDIEFDLIFKNKIFPAFEPYQNQKNIRIHILPGCSKLLFNQWRLPRCLNHLHADRYLFFAFPMPILLRKKHVYSTIHDMGCWDCPETMKTYMAWYFRLSYRCAARRAERIITISEFSKGRIRQILNVPEDKILIAYCGVSEEFQGAQDTGSGTIEDARAAANEEFQKARGTADKKTECAILRRKYHLPDEYYLCLSTLEPRKNMLLLLNTYLDLYRQGRIKTRLVLAGRKGWKIEELLTRAGAAEKADQVDRAGAAEKEDRLDRAGAAEKADTEEKPGTEGTAEFSPVTVTGFIDDADLPSIYRMAKCFIFPSIYEGFGIPPLEAMAQGVPVISSDATSMPEILGDAPLYFKSGDAEDLKRAILEMERLISGENKGRGRADSEAVGCSEGRSSSEDGAYSESKDSSRTGDRLRSDMAAAGLRRSALFRYENEAKKIYQSMGIN